MTLFTRLVLASCFLTGLSNGQTLPNPTNISGQGSFLNLSGSGFIADNFLDDGYAAGADLYGAPAGLLPTAERGNAFLQWGSPVTTGDHSSALWYQRLYSSNVALDEPFDVAYLYYRNGTLGEGPGIGGFDLQIVLNRPVISLPNNLNPTVTSFAVGLLDTPDTGSAAQNADSVLLQQNYFLSPFKDSADHPYYFKVSFADPSGATIANPTSFAVNEGEVGRVTVKGVFTTVPEPSAAVLGGLGALVLFRRRRG